jgi:hypothetical protein
MYRVRVDGGVLEQVGVAGSTSFVAETAAHDWVLLRRSDEPGALEVVRRSDLEATVVAEIPPDVSSVAGGVDRYFYFKAEGQPLLLVGFDDVGPIASHIAGTDTMYTPRCLNSRWIQRPADRDAIAVARDRIALLDLSQPEADLAGWIESTEPDAYLSCPTWSADGRSLIYNQSGESQDHIFYVAWGDDGPSEPRLLRSSDTNVGAFAVR